jgi:NTE family protein
MNVLITGTTSVIGLSIARVFAHEVIKTVREMQVRMNDVSFNLTLKAEMQMIHLKDSILTIGYDLKEKLLKIYFHNISADHCLAKYSLSSKFNISNDFLLRLHAQGRAAAKIWLDNNLDKVEVENSINIRNFFL